MNKQAQSIRTHNSILVQEKETMKEKTTDRDDFAEAMRILSNTFAQTEAEFGRKSPELAALIFNFGGTDLVKTFSEGSDGNMKISYQILVTEKGVPLRQTILSSYLFHDPALTEQRLDKVESSIRSQKNIFGIIDVDQFKEIIPGAQHLASCFQAGGRPETSEALIRIVSENCRVRLDPGDPLMVAALDALAVIRLKQGELVEAQELLEEALEKCEQSGDAMSAHGPAVLMNLHSISMARGEHETAQEHLCRAHRAAASGPYKRDYGYLLEELVNLARLYGVLAMNDDVEKVLVDIKRVTIRALKSDPWFSVTYVSPPAEVWDSDIFIEFISNLDTVVREGDRNRCFGILKLYFDLLRSKPLRRTLGHEHKFPEFPLPD
jgi:hypothetical protein